MSILPRRIMRSATIALDTIMLARAAAVPALVDSALIIATAKLLGASDPAMVISASVSGALRGYVEAMIAKGRWRR